MSLAKIYHIASACVSNVHQFVNVEGRYRGCKFYGGRGVGTDTGPPPPSFAKCPFSGSKVPFSCVKNVIKIAFFAQRALLKT
jgi:hypothetical protein